jgi:hypothetical protein
VLSCSSPHRIFAWGLRLCLFQFFFVFVCILAENAWGPISTVFKFIPGKKTMMKKRNFSHKN